MRAPTSVLRDCNLSVEDSLEPSSWGDLASDAIQGPVDAIIKVSIYIIVCDGLIVNKLYKIEVLQTKKGPLPRFRFI